MATINLIGKRVYVYRNLKHGRKSPPLYSVMYKGRVISRCHYVLLTDCEFRVRRSGFLQFKRTGRKNVHAFVIGTVKDLKLGCISYNRKPLHTKITYNPNDAPEFMTVPDFKVAYQAGIVMLNNTGISASGINYGI